MYMCKYLCLCVGIRICLGYQNSRHGGSNNRFASVLYHWLLESQTIQDQSLEESPKGLISLNCKFSPACLLFTLLKPPPSENKNLRIHPAESIIYNHYTIKIYSKKHSIQFSIKFPQSQNPNTQTNSYRTKYDLNQRFDCKCPSDKEMIFSLNCKLFFAQIPRAAHHYFPDVFAP